MSLMVVVGPGEGSRPDMRRFTQLLYSWNEALSRYWREDDRRLYVRYMRQGSTWIYVYTNLRVGFVPSEFLGPLCPEPFIPYLYYHQPASRVFNRPVRLRLFYELPRDLSRWTVFSTYEAISYWNPWRSEDWSVSDPFREVVVNHFRRVMRSPPLENIPRGDYNYFLRG